MGKNVNYQTRILTFHQHLSDEAFLFLHNVMNSFLRNCSCRKVKSINMSRLETRFGFYKLLMKGFDVYLL